MGWSLALPSDGGGREAAGGTGGTITWGPDELTRAAISISNGKARGDQTHFTVMIGAFPCTLSHTNAQCN